MQYRWRKSSDDKLDNEHRRILGDIRWWSGQWEYHGFNSELWDQDWEASQDAVSIQVMDGHSDDEVENPVAEQFMRTICRALARLERSGSFGVLMRTADFEAGCANHDEWAEDSMRRLSDIRNEMNRS